MGGPLVFSLLSFTYEGTSKVTWGSGIRRCFGAKKIVLICVPEGDLQKVHENSVLKTMRWAYGAAMKSLLRVPAILHLCVLFQPQLTRFHFQLPAIVHPSSQKAVVQVLGSHMHTRAGET